MELRHLKYFIAVAEELNFTRAAERLRTAQPSLSQQIRDLEDEVGTPLFYRNKRKVELTRAGATFLGSAKQILLQVEQAVTTAREASRTVSGDLAIGFVPSAEIKIFPKILPILRTRYPQVHIVLHSMDGPSISDALWERRIDVAFCRNDEIGEEFTSEKVFSEGLLAVLPTGCSLAHESAVSAAMLSSQDFIAVSDASAPELRDTVEQIFADAGIALKPAQVAENVFTNLNLVSMGMGVGVLPDYVEHLGIKGVEFKQIIQAPTIDLYVVWRRAHASPVMQSFLDVLRSISW